MKIEAKDLVTEHRENVILVWLSREEAAMLKTAASYLQSHSAQTNQYAIAFFYRPEILDLFLAIYDGLKDEVQSYRPMEDIEVKKFESELPRQPVVNPFEEQSNG